MALVINPGEVEKLSYRDGWFKIQCKNGFCFEGRLANFRIISHRCGIEINSPIETTIEMEGIFTGETHTKMVADNSVSSLLDEVLLALEERSKE